MSGESRTEAELIEEKLDLCIKMLQRFNLTDYNGHVSYRLAPDRVLITTVGDPKGESWGSESGVAVIDLEGKKVEGELGPPIEIPIHNCVYQAYPEVKAVAHLHSESPTILAIAGIPIKPVSPYGAVFGFDPLPLFPESDLIRYWDQGERMAKALGQAKALILQGHGIVLAAQSVEEILHLAVGLEKNCRFLTMASYLGNPQYLTEEEVRRFTREPANIMKTWNYYLAMLKESIA